MTLSIWGNDSMKHDGTDSSIQNVRPIDMLVPDDFPRPESIGAISGAIPKLLLVEYEGKLYPSGCTPLDILGRWDICEDLVQQFQSKCLETKRGKRADMLEELILEQYLTRLLGTGWVSAAEGRWIIRRVAIVLNWPMPEILAYPAKL
jgi:hypothetical protein